MAANYKSCPLKKRPFVFVEEQPQTEALALTKSSQFATTAVQPQEEQPQDLSLKRKASDIDFEDYELPAKREYVLNLSKTPLTPRRAHSPLLSSALLSPPAESSSQDYQPTDIHMRGLTAATAGYTTNPYQSAFVLAAGCNPISALWSSYQPHLNSAAAFPSPASSIASPHSVYSYQQMTPPSSPGSDASSEPEDLSVRNDIPLPALFHLFDETRSSSHSSSSISSSNSNIAAYSYAATSNISGSNSTNAVNVSAKNYRYKCDNCQKMYSTSMGLSKHRQFHCPAAECNQEKKPHSCEECGKLYTTIGALKMHIRTHTLPCKCPICGKAFSRPWLLQGHIRTHTGEKPFQCPDCPRSFADRSNLRAHQQTHVDVKKYACQVCHKSFSRMSLLNKHTSSNCTITIV
ncbi:protein snail [Drosophila grimshawi]|uniref:GH13116 n=1 Tax=Drosophila grimshawi TaxID=7222 RepID=B4JQU3_DROGR|nr:protein snail [Drosophila grimshawi]EDV99273.1 GH13116 [Drosophila grimshawi]